MARGMGFKVHQKHIKTIKSVVGPQEQKYCLCWDNPVLLLTLYTARPS